MRRQRPRSRVDPYTVRARSGRASFHAASSLPSVGPRLNEGGGEPEKIREEGEAGGARLGRRCWSAVAGAAGGAGWTLIGV